MKTSLFLIFAMLATSCMPLLYSKKYTSYDLSHIPARYGGVPDIFYANEGLPAKPYVEAVDMEITVDNSAVDGKSLIRMLEIRAIMEKVDGVIVLDRDQVSFRSGGYVYGAGVRAIGFIYLENITYLNLFIKNEELFLIADSSSSPLLAASVDYLPDGKVNDVHEHHPGAENLYNTYIRNFSDYHLLRENENWVETYIDDKLTSRELLRFDDWVVKKAAISYRISDRNQVHRIRIASNELRSQVYYVIDYIYDKQNVLRERIIKKDGSKHLKEKLFYDGQEKLIAKDYYLYEKGGEKHFMKSLYSHYFNTDLPELLEQDSMFVVYPTVSPKQ